MLLKTEIDGRLTAAVGYSLADNEALANLRDAGGPLRMGEIADRLTLSRGGVTKLIDRLEAAGYVKRVPDATDRRATGVEITTEGRAVVEGARPIIVAALWDLWGRHLSDAEADSLTEILHGIATSNEWLC
jgi:DNA-binding MarR family transcriptional regulator